LVFSGDINPAALITVTTSPAGRQIVVGSTSYTSPQTFAWSVGSFHSIGVISPQSGGTGTQYVFSLWSDGGAQSHSITTPTSPTTYTANFTTQYTLSTSANPSAGGTVNPSGSNWYNDGQPVSISAMPNSGYTFIGWSGDISGTTNPASITINGPMTVTANFSQVNYTLSLSKTGNGSVRVNGTLQFLPWSGQYASGTEVQLEAVPDSGWSFSSWSGDLGGNVKTTSITMNGNRTVTANFAAIPCPTSGTPSDPSPSNGATGQPTSLTLSWSNTSNTDSYDVYFGTSSNPPYVGNTTSLSYPQSGLSYSTTYYWKTVARNNCGNFTSGSVWSFTIGSAPCPTPGTPSNPSPSDGATNVSTNPIMLSWGAASNADSYDFYFGISSDATFVGTTTGTTYPRSYLMPNTTYYWKIVAKNNCGNSTSGPIWSFTTVNIEPDLTGEWRSLSQSCKKGKCKIAGTFLVENKGNRDSTPTYAYFYLSDDGVTYQEGAWLKRVRVSKIKAVYGSKPINLSCNLSPGESALGKYIIAVISPLPSEVDQTNNVISSGPIQ
jgi:uncharacterized repeat protein (TIGR02543 family)